MFKEQQLADAELVLSIIDLPFVRLSHFIGNGKTFYAVVVVDAKPKYGSWCHREYVNPWHSSAYEAWNCFERNHPGLIDALRRLNELLEPQGN